MSKIIIYGLLIVGLILNTLFGLGPVIYSDGTMSERLITFAIVLLIYFLLGGSLLLLVRRDKRRTKAKR